MATFTLSADTKQRAQRTYKFGDDRKMKMCVYTITNLLNGMVYVGQSRGEVGVRWRSHVNNSGSGVSVIKNAIRKNGIEFFEFKVIDFCENSKQLDYKEEFYIAKLNTMSPNGYNLCSGGSGGRVFSDESRAKMKASGLKRFGKIISRKDAKANMTDDEKAKRALETTSNRRNARLGKPSGRKGKPMPKEGIEKMRQSKLGKEVPNNWKAIQSSDGEIFQSLKECVSNIGCHRATLQKHLSGRLKTLYGKSYSYMTKEV